MAEVREGEVYETATKIAAILAEIRQANFESQAATVEFRRKALEAIGRLNAFLKTLQIPECYTDMSFYSKYYESKWESGYRLILEDSQLKIEEYDEWRAQMYPESENPILSFADLPAERLADALECLPNFLSYIAERLKAKKEKYQRLAEIASAIGKVIDEVKR